MKTTEVRKKLYEYIRDADSRKVKAIYTMVESDIESTSTQWSDDFFQSQLERTKSLKKAR
jgi:DNA-binding protein Fis